MCRFVLYLGSEITVKSLVTEPENSLIHQSFDNEERAEPLNGDGFGLAWYAPALSDRPALFRSVRPAWSNQNLRQLARVTSSRCILAHVRAATPGLPVQELNCHPFAWGPFTFMHNGLLGGFRQIRRRIQERLSDEAFDAIAGSTDSEHFFALFVHHHLRLTAGRGPAGRGPDDTPLARMERALLAAIAEVEEIRRQAGVDEPTLLNLALSDGERAVATRFTSGDPSTANSLYVHVGERYVCEDRTCRMIAPDVGRGAVIVSSERLSHDPGWERVAVNDLVSITEDLEVRHRPIELDL